MPSAFISDVEKTNFYTFMVTMTGNRTFTDYMEAKTGSKGSTGGYRPQYLSKGANRYVNQVS